LYKPLEQMRMLRRNLTDESKGASWMFINNPTQIGKDAWKKAMKYYFKKLLNG